MTKSALIFSGIPRFLRRSRVNFLENLINVNNVDMYSYVWRRDEYAAVPYCYAHETFEFIEPKNFDHLGTNQHNIYPHWYSVKIACQRFISYINSHNLHYDLVIRTRHDIVLFHQINLSELDTNLIHIADCHWSGHGTNIIDDNLTILSVENYQKIYEHAYDWYITRNNRTHDDISEVMLSQCIRDLGLLDRVVRNPKLDFILTRGVI